VRNLLTHVAIGFLVLQPFTKSHAVAANAFERAIGEAQPCRSLKAKVSSFGLKVEIGVDKFDSVKVDSLQISVDGDMADASARGTLACKTSDDALVKGGFSATAEVHVKVDLMTCGMIESSVSIVDTGGLFGDVVKGLEKEISDAFRRSLERNVKKLCEK
jgi:hypothetical protein